ncbi:MAG: hypothetical protein ACON4O_04275 [Lentimonas sp.]
MRHNRTRQLPAQKPSFKTVHTSLVAATGQRAFVLAIAGGLVFAAIIAAQPALAQIDRIVNDDFDSNTGGDAEHWNLLISSSMSGTFKVSN